jgi:Na+/glutamate symporter
MADHYVDPARAAGHRTTAEIIQDIGSTLQDMVRSEIRMARTEMTDRAKKFSRAAVVLAAGVVLLAVAGALIIATATAALAVAIPVWAACLVMAVLLAIIGGGMAAAGRTRIRRANMKPVQTINSLREDVEWLKRQTR